MRRYPEYKESGMEWIGELPKHWKILPFTHCLKKVKTKKKTSIPKMDYQESGEFPVIDQGASFIAGWTDFTNSVISDNLPVVVFGDHTRIFKYVDFPFTLGADGTQLLYPNDDILNPRFFYYALLNLKIPNKGYNRHYRYLREFSVACPAFPTQRAIVNFLDRKTEQIDELIRIKERRIELLQEQRTTLINQAVTKGLDPNVEMKPSGVEWIGEIPKHWEVRRNKRIFNQRDDRSTTGKEELLTVSHITGVSPRAEKNVGMFLAETLEGYKHCSVGNLVINTMWAWMGALGISTFDGIVSPSYNVYELKSDEYLPRYYDYLYRTPNHVKEIIRWSKGIWHSRWRLYPDAFFSMFTITPPFREQHQIVNFLEYKNKQIDELIAAERRKIELLKEYRQSLISEAVTGKIDVRSEV